MDTDSSYEVVAPGSSPKKQSNILLVLFISALIVWFVYTQTNLLERFVPVLDPANRAQLMTSPTSIARSQEQGGIQGSVNWLKKKSLETFDESQSMARVGNLLNLDSSSRIPSLGSVGGNPLDIVDDYPFDKRISHHKGRLSSDLIRARMEQLRGEEKKMRDGCNFSMQYRSYH